MDAVIKAAVKEELRRQVTQSQEQTQPRTVSERQNPAGNGLSNRTVTRLSGLLQSWKLIRRLSNNFPNVPPSPLYNVDVCMKSRPEVYVMINIVFGGKGGLFRTILAVNI